MIPKTVSYGTLTPDGLQLTGDRSGVLRNGIEGLRKGDCVYMPEGEIAFVAGLVKGLGKGVVIGQPGAVMGVVVDGVRFLSYAAWGADSPEGIERAWLECSKARIKWHATAGATVAGLVPSKHPLAPRWRGMAAAAVHAGPILHTRGGCDYGVHIDRSQAYLQSIRHKMPGDSSWYLDTPSARVAVRDDLAIVTAMVRVRETPEILDIPPLPVKAAGGTTVYPVGTFSGTWPAFLLRAAVARGEAEILQVKHRIRPASRSWEWRDIADQIDTLPKAVRKPLYTRVWGKCVSRGGIIGTAEKRPGCYRKNGLWWGASRGPIWDPRKPPHYRPDIAAHITGRNMHTMIAAVRTLEPGSLVSTHVDSIWSSDVAGCDRLLAGGGWREEGRGEVRFPGTGRYAVQGEHGLYMGHSGTEEPDSVAALVEQTGTPKGAARGWFGDPSKDARAHSAPPSIELVRTWAKVEGYPVDSDVWHGAYLPDATVRMLRNQGGE